MKAVPTTAIRSILRMKSWATALVLLALAATTQAGVIAYDDLEDAVLGSLVWPLSEPRTASSRSS